MAKDSTQFQKIDWLLKNQNLWEGFGIHTTFAKRNRLKREMLQAGLYTEISTITDRILNDLVQLARTERRNRYAENLRKALLYGKN